MLGRQLILPKNTIEFYGSFPKIFEKKLVFWPYLYTGLGIASVSHPSLIILSAPKHEVKFSSSSPLLSFFFILFLLIFVVLDPKKFEQNSSKL